MGVSLSWLAVRDKSPEAVRAELQLHSTSILGDVPESSYIGSHSKAGWYLVVARGCEHRFIKAPVMQRVSLGCDAITCTVEEHVMFSQAAGWRDGRRLWLITHKGEDGPQGINAEGAPPPEYASIRDNFISRQEAEGGMEADVDFLFEIPVVLAQTFTGYKHDEGSPAFEAGGFEVLESTPKSLFQRLFSK